MGLSFSLVDIGTYTHKTFDLFSLSITHNLRKMAQEAGIYNTLWDSDGEIASNLIEELTVGLDLLKDDSEYYHKFDSPNGWGVYPDFVEFVTECLDACKSYPNARVASSR